MNTKHKISQVLWSVWDPIGVNSHPQCRDEYDSYVDGVYELLVSGASDDEIAGHLLHIASETMGLAGPTLEHMRPTVQALRKV
jgi:hypothetical protein